MEFVAKVVFIIMCYHLVLNIVKATLEKLAYNLEQQLEESAKLHNIDDK